jgi:hypothetical protein
MNAKRVVQAFVATAVGVGVIALAPVAAQAKPANTCAHLATVMRLDINIAHAARARGDNLTWSIYQDLYVATWYEYQDLGC